MSAGLSRDDDRPNSNAFSRFLPSEKPREKHQTFLLGVLEGEGIGPDVIASSLEVLRALESQSEHTFALEYGGEIGVKAKAQSGKPLPPTIIEWCRDIFSRGGAILNGPGGDRYVYDLRVQFDLFCKFSPLRVSPALHNATRLKPQFVRDLDILLVRENSSGFYQGASSNVVTDNGRRAEQICAYEESEVRRILEVAHNAADARRKKLAVIIKEGGAPTLSQLWRDCADEMWRDSNIEYSFLNIDHAAYRLIQHPHEFDVIVAPNLFGDSLGDLGAVLLGSRGLSYSGNYDGHGAAVYQTNHGSGYDLVGKNLANPVGQIFSLSMMLRDFGLTKEADLIENAVESVWQRGWRTFDLAENANNQFVVGTRQMTSLIVHSLLEKARENSAVTVA